MSRICKILPSPRKMCSVNAFFPGCWPAAVRNEAMVNYSSKERVYQALAWNWGINMSHRLPTRCVRIIPKPFACGPRKSESNEVRCAYGLVRAAEPPPRLPLGGHGRMEPSWKDVVVLLWYGICKAASSALQWGSSTGIGGRWCNRAPKSLDLVKIPQNQGKISENLHKIPENSSKNGAQHALACKKWHPNWHEELFLEVTLYDIFSGRLGEFGQNSIAPQKFACSYAYGSYPCCFFSRPCFRW